MDACKRILNVGISQYADDFALYTSSNDINSAVQDLSDACQELNSILTSLGLSISASKSKVCVFKKGGYRKNVDLKIDDITLPTVQCYKYLGLWLDSPLRWSKHIAEISQTVSRLINVLKVLAGSGWGVHQKHLRRLYIALIRSRLDYASFLYDNSCKTNLTKLDRIQNQALRVIGGYIKSTPIHVMESDLHIPPLFIRRHYLAAKFFLRSKSISNNRTISIIRDLANNCDTTRSYWNNKRRPVLISIFNSELNLLPIYGSSRPQMFTLSTWVSNVNLIDVINISIPGIERAKRLYQSHELYTLCVTYINQQYGNCHKIFTDGSKDGTGGAAFLDPVQQCQVKLKIDADISIMNIELIAIAEALSYCRTIDSDKIVILTDSKSALQHLARCSSHGRGIPIAYRILETILSLHNSNKNIYLQWIPSHIQLKENDEVDLLARHATVDGIPYNVIPVYSNFFRIVKERCIVLWQEYFDERSKERGIWYRTIQPEITAYPWIDNSRLDRQLLTTALRIRSAHIPSKKFAFMMRKTSSPNCAECGVVEDVQHLLMECVRNEQYRRQWFYMYGIYDVGFCNTILASPMSAQAILLYKLVDLALSV